MADEKKSSKSEKDWEYTPTVEQPPEAYPYNVDNQMYDTEQIAPDGHLNLSKEDIEHRG